LLGCSDSCSEYKDSVILINKYFQPEKLPNIRKVVFFPKNFCIGCNQVLGSHLKRKEIPKDVLIIIYDTSIVNNAFRDQVIFDSLNLMETEMLVGLQPYYCHLNSKGCVTRTKTFNTVNYKAILDSLDLR
jgi:hypothetical protein